jgi:cytidylate kinase
MPRSLVLSEHVGPIIGAIRTVPIPVHPGELPEPPPPPPPRPFITISREPGAGALTFARQLVDELNSSDPGDRPWSCWDRELVQKVADDLHLSSQLIDSLEEANHSWFSDFLNSLSFADEGSFADEARIYRRVVATIRALAQAGRVVIVGRGGVFVTRNMPGGIHLRLIAPFEKRVEFMAAQLHFSREAAAAYIKQLDKNRRAFLARYWPKEVMTDETFTLVINSAAVKMETMVDIVKSLVRQVAVRA